MLDSRPLCYTLQRWHCSMFTQHLERYIQKKNTSNVAPEAEVFAFCREKFAQTARGRQLSNEFAGA